MTGGAGTINCFWTACILATKGVSFENEEFGPSDNMKPPELSSASLGARRERRADLCEYGRYRGAGTEDWWNCSLVPERFIETSTLKSRRRDPSCRITTSTGEPRASNRYLARHRETGWTLSGTMHGTYRECQTLLMDSYRKNLRLNKTTRTSLC